ncbi:MAG: NAD(P)-dependent oxidoreductase [Gammaproteobacteria bacterium]|nr:NAD(P)-dependent oxidoreductase [Gammaproteobacteria bacterium]
MGRRCGEALKRIGMEVVGIGRTPKENVLGIDDLVKQLPLADHIVLLLPGERSTDGLIGSVELAQCKPGAFIYNFGRGNALPTSALLAHLDHLGGAFLDVVDQEPLPAGLPALVAAERYDHAPLILRVSRL